MKNGKSLVSKKAVDALKACATAPTKDTTLLARVVSKIRETALADFKATELPRFQRLLEALSGGGLPLASLSVCGYSTAEVRYTRLLRYFLDPQAPHGLGASVLQAILIPEIEAMGFAVEDIEFDRAKVEAEVNLGKIPHGGGSQGCTLDLLITL